MRLLNIGITLLQVNGIRWTILYTLYWFTRYFLRIDSTGLYKLLILFEEKHNLPGFNSPATASALWDLLPWEKEGGEEWTVSEEWKKALIDDVLLANIKPGTTVLEIGPGAGRWTETLQRTARKLFAVDVSSKAIELCRKRFSSATNTTFVLTRTPTLEFIPEKSIDAIWSYDVFVHINPDDTDRYLSEFKRVLVPGGIAVIHHPKSGGRNGGCRSRMTAEQFSALLERNGLTLDRQFDSWGQDGRFDITRHGDCISIFHS